MNLLIKPCWLLLENLVQNEIGHAAYGTFAALFSLGFLFVVLSDLGINYHITRKIAANMESQRSLFSDVFGFKLLLLTVYPVFMGLMGWALDYGYLDIFYLFLISITQGLLQMVLFLRANFQGRQQFNVDSFAGVTEKIFLILIVAALMKMGELSLMSFILSRLAATLAAFLIFYIVVVRSLGWMAPRFNSNNLKELLRSSWPFALMTLLYAFNEKVDQVMLERIAGDHESGLYAGAYRWLEAFMMYIWTIMPLFFAKFAYFQKDIPQMKKIFNSGQVLSAVPMIFISVFVFFFGDKLLWLYTNSLPAELLIMESTLKILFIAAMLNGVFVIYGTLLNAVGEVKVMSWLILASILINITLNFIFIPEYGTGAAAMATAVSSLVLCGSSVIAVALKDRQILPWGLLVKIVVFSLVCAGSFYLVHHSGIEWYIVTLVAAIVSAVAAFFLGFFKIIFAKD